MERLTGKDENGLVFLICKEDCLGGPACFECEQRAASRLYDYEDTGFLPSDIKDMHNELCLKCGKYKDAHLGACDGCRWQKKGDGENG